MLEELIHCHSSVNYFLCMPFFLRKCQVSGQFVPELFSQSISDRGKIIQLNHWFNFFFFLNRAFQLAESSEAGSPQMHVCSCIGWGFPALDSDRRTICSASLYAKMWKLLHCSTYRGWKHWKDPVKMFYSCIFSVSLSLSSVWGWGPQPSLCSSSRGKSIA